MLRISSRRFNPLIVKQPQPLASASKRTDVTSVVERIILKSNQQPAILEDYQKAFRLAVRHLDANETEQALTSFKTAKEALSALKSQHPEIYHRYNNFLNDQISNVKNQNNTLSQPHKLEKSTFTKIKVFSGVLAGSAIGYTYDKRP